MAIPHTAQYADAFANAVPSTLHDWAWATVRVPRPSSGVFEFRHHSDDGLEERPCFEVPGAPLQVRVPTDAWRATGLDLASFPDEATDLLTRFPSYPEALVTLPPPPDVLPEQPLPADGIPAALAWQAERMRRLQPWLAACAMAIKQSVGAVEAAGADLRDLVANSRFNDWHISAVDPRAGTITVMGRPLKVSCLPPVGSTQDLTTIHVAGFLKGVWRARFRPRLVLEGADYGTRRLQISLGSSNAHAGARRYWLDLETGQIKAIPPPRPKRRVAGFSRSPGSTPPPDSLPPGSSAPRQ